MWNEPNATSLAAEESLPPELVEVSRRIAADAVEWSQHTPSAEPFTHRMRAALLASAQSASGDEVSEGIMGDQGEAPTAQQSAQGASRQEPRRASTTRTGALSRWRPPLAMAAAVLVVALLAGVFATLGRDHLPQSGTSTTATPVVTATATRPANTPTPASGLLAGAPLTNQPGVPVVAPSDPRVLYEYSDGENSVVLRSSIDGGVDWNVMVYPNTAGSVGAVALAVNPVNARNVFLDLQVGYLPGDPYPCTAARSGASAPLTAGAGITKLQGGLASSSGGECSNTYVSRNGGANWSYVQLPVAGSMFASGSAPTYDATVFQTQGSALYGRVWQIDTSTGFLTGDVRIVRSDDQGASWRVADAGLQDQTGHICALSAEPAGTAIFAVISTAVCWNWTVGMRSVWRSDDGGGAWKYVGALPASVAQPGVVFTAASVGAVSPAFLYALPMAGAILKPSEIKASGDGGQSWISAPSAGLPKDARPLVSSATPLSDGELVVAFTTASTQSNVVGPTSTYAWSPGLGAWRNVTPQLPVDGAAIANVYVSTGQALVVTLSVQEDQSSSPTYTLITFTLH